MNIKVSDFFKVIIQSQTYLNMLYLLLAFPLGIIYFVFLVTGVSLGLGLIITWLGIPILLGTLLVWRVLGDVERELAKVMLNIKIRPIKLKKSKGIWKKIEAYLSDSFTWTSAAYLLIKFPLGIISFVFLVTLLSVSLSLIATPIMYYLIEIGLIQGTFCMPNNICFVNSYFSASFITILGIILLFVSLHIFNGLAYVSGLLAKFLLSE